MKGGAEIAVENGVSSADQLEQDQASPGVDNAAPRAGSILFQALIIFFIGVVLSASIFHNAPFFTRGEAREALVVEAMIEKSDLVLPVTNAGQISAKPPLFHWIAIGLSQITGQADENTIRLVSALTASLSLALFFIFAAFNSGTQTAWLTVIILATSVEWFRSGTHARVDSCLALGISWALCSFYWSLRRYSESKSISWLWLFSAAIGVTLAILSKGPMGLAIPAAIIGIYWLVKSGYPYFKGFVTFPYFSHSFALILGATVAGVWYLMAYQHMPEEFFRVHVINENLARFMEVPDYHPGHRKPFYFGPIYLFTALLPWSLLLPLLIVWLRKRSNISDGVLFSLVWAGVIVAMGCITSAKRSVYFLPAFPALAYLFALAVQDAIRNPGQFTRAVGISRKLLYSVSGVAVLVVAVATVFAVSDSFAQFVLESGVVRAKDLAKVELARELLQRAAILFPISLLVTTGIFFGARWCNAGNLKRSVESLAFSIVLGSLMIGFGFVRNFAEAIEPSTFTQELEARLPANARIYQYKDVYFAVSYYGNQFMPRIDTVELESEEPVFFLVEKKREQEFLALAPEAELVFEGGEFTANSKGTLAVFQVH